MNNLGTFYTNLGKTANKHLNSINSSTNSLTKAAVNSTNSLTKSANSHLNSFVNSTNETLSNVHNSLRNIAMNTPKVINDTVNSFAPSTISASETKTSWTYPVLLFIILSSVFIFLIVKNKDKISASINNLIQTIRGKFNEPTMPLVDATTHIVDYDVTDSPTPPQEEIQTAIAQASEHKATPIINTILPIGNAEVFNVSKNEYPYYDAEPLCQALGAQLATYDQVKEAWSKGADWCNYGWVKGQAAVYPIQEETWNKIQSGPEENRNVCGEVGVNGGYFENPELKFGVNCYGIKPPQSGHDEEVLMKKGTIPHSVPTLEVDKKIKEFKAHADNLGVLPFNTHKWE